MADTELEPVAQQDPGQPGQRHPQAHQRTCRHHPCHGRKGGRPPGHDPEADQRGQIGEQNGGCIVFQRFGHGIVLKLPPSHLPQHRTQHMHKIAGEHGQHHHAAKHEVPHLHGNAKPAQQTEHQQQNPKRKPALQQGRPPRIKQPRHQRHQDRHTGQPPRCRFGQQRKWQSHNAQYDQSTDQCKTPAQTAPVMGNDLHPSKSPVSFHAYPL